jgi:hypothetical protein
LAQEIADRQAADAVLQGNIDTEKARIDAILLASDADKDSFAEIVNLINSVDTENDNAFASYVLSNDAALAQEVSDRTAAVSAEAAARSAADADLASDLADETAAREAADSAESAARQAADSTLQSNIDAEVAARQAAVSAEEAARTAADADLASDLSDEAAARSAADTTLQSNIDSEAAARAAGDSAEQAAREAADATLQSNIDSEAAARQMADSAETAAREAADSALDVRLDAIEAVTHRKEKFTLTSTDLSNGYVDLAVTCVTDSEMVFVGALYLHDGDHYTTSVVNSKTRISFAGDMVVGGLSELVAGDVVYVRYQSAQTPSGGEGGGGGDTGGGGGGGGEPTGPLSLSFMGAGESMMGPESIDIGWSATNGTNDTYYYLYEVTGPSTYSNPIYLNSGGTWGTVLKSQIDPMKFYVIGGGSMDTSIPPEAVTSSFQMPDGTAGT